MMRRHILLRGLLGLSLVLLMVGPAQAGDEDALMSPDEAKPSAAMHNDEGVSHYSQGHWKISLGHFEQAIKADPTFAEAHFNLALTLDQMRDHEKATAHFEKAAELGKTNKKIQESKKLKAHLRME